MSVSGRKAQPGLCSAQARVQLVHAARDLESLAGIWSRSVPDYVTAITRTETDPTPGGALRRRGCLTFAFHGTLQAAVLSAHLNPFVVYGGAERQITGQVGSALNAI